ELLKTATPKLSRAAVLWDSTTGRAQVKATEAGARALALQVQIFPVEGLDTFGAVLEAVRSTRPGGLVVLSSPFLLQQRRRLAYFAGENRLPAISMFREFAEEGCLMAYGPNYIDMTRRGALAIDRILKGAKPGDVPIERPQKFDFVINLKTAKALGLTIPPSLLARADQVIE
ncbi:MAG TPA: ABC transporter substrate-binding protein, partial [bacterium]|nr:ABC transporter substrate-binding protein [bacterium]